MDCTHSPHKAEPPFCVQAETTGEVGNSIQIGGSRSRSTRPPRSLSLAYFTYLGKAGYSTGVQWLAGALLLGGVLAQSGGFFVHLGMGQPGRRSPGTVLTRGGALLIAAALSLLAVGLINHG